MKANLCIRLFLLTIILILSASVRGQVADGLSNAQRQFLNFELDSCSTTLSSSGNTHSNFYLKSLITSATIFVNDNSQQYNDSKHLESDLLDELSMQPFPNEYANFLKAEIKLQWAILKFRNGDHFSAFWSLRQAYNISENNIKNHPEFMPSYKTLGLLHVLYGSFPDQYNWILSLLGLEDDVKKGLQELNIAGQEGGYLAIETKILTALMHSYLLNDTQKGASIMYSMQVEGSYLLIDYAHALLLIKNAESEKALSVLKKAAETYTQPFKVSQIYHAYGEILLQKGEYDEAVEWYRKFLIEKSRGNLVKDAYYKIGLCYFMENMADSASSYFKTAALKGQTKNEADKHAMNAVESGVTPNKELLMLRYATDGGYYEKAEIICSKIDENTLNNHDKCEFWYRSARLHHKTGQIEKAIRGYQQVIDLQKEKDWYFAPNSCLQLALIYTERQQLENARKYLKLVNDYSGYPYQNSIRQKSKAALRQLN